MKLYLCITMHPALANLDCLNTVKDKLFWRVLKSFYGKGTQYRFLSEAVNQIQYNDSESADVVVIGPPTGGQESVLGNENDEIFNTKDLLEKIAGEVEVFNIRNNGNGRITSVAKIAMWYHHQRRKKNKMLKNSR